MNQPRPLLASPSQSPIEAVVIGASAGGVQALLRLLTDLPDKFQLPLIALLHLPAARNSQLAEVFQHRLLIAVREAADKEKIAPATLYFAGPGYHLSIETDHSFSLSGEAPVHYSRPSIDVLMEGRRRLWPQSGRHLADRRECRRRCRTGPHRSARWTDRGARPGRGRGLYHAASGHRQAAP